MCVLIPLLCCDTQLIFFNPSLAPLFLLVSQHLWQTFMECSSSTETLSQQNWTAGHPRWFILMSKSCDLPGQLHCTPHQGNHGQLTVNFHACCWLGILLSVSPLHYQKYLAICIHTSHWGACSVSCHFDNGLLQLALGRSTSECSPSSTNDPKSSNTTATFIS